MTPLESPVFSTVRALISHGPPPKSGGNASLPRVLFYYLDYGSMGGIARYIQQVAGELRARGHFKPVVVCTADTPFYHAMQQAGFEVYGIPVPAYVPKCLMKYYMKPFIRLFDWPLQVKLTRLLAQLQPQVVHIHMGRMENLLFKRLGYPVVYTFHGYAAPFNIQEAQNALARCCIRASRPLFRALVPHLDALLFVSRAEQQRVQAEGFLPPGYSGQVLHNGQPIEGLAERARLTDQNALRQSLGIPQEALCVSFINRIDRFKNPLLFLRLAERLVQEPDLPPMRFLIAGSGHQVPELLTTIENSPIQDWVRFVGHRTDVPELLAVTDLAVCLPQMEGFGFSVLEAMATGTPCLAFATGGIPEIMAIPEARPLLVPTGDFEALVQQALTLLRLPDATRRSLGQALQKRAMVFDIRVLVDRLEEIYARILGPYSSQAGLTSVSSGVCYSSCVSR